MGGGGWNKDVLGGKISKNEQSGVGDDYSGLESRCIKINEISITDQNEIAKNFNEHFVTNAEKIAKHQSQNEK